MRACVYTSVAEESPCERGEVVCMQVYVYAWESRYLTRAINTVLWRSCVLWCAPPPPASPTGLCS